MTTGTHVSLPILAIVLSVGLAAVHVFGSRLGDASSRHGKPLLSVAAGVSVAYVFVHVLPEIARAGEEVERAGVPLLASVDHHVFVVSLVGFLAFYGLERIVQSAGSTRDEGRGDVFWLHVVSFALYNAFVGYLLLHRETAEAMSLLFFAVAMGFHFAVNDHALRRHHADSYRHGGRWVLAAAIVGGSVLGLVVEVGAPAIGVLFAFLSGAIVFNNVKEEFPLESRARFWPFALGAGGYAALLLLI